MADTVYYNPTLGLQNITPALDDETFLFFLSAYYDWMQTTDITFNGASGAFSNGEIITGQDSRATATIRYVGSNTITVSMKTEIPFDLGEELVGGTSANSAFVLELSDNVLRKASHIRENKNNEKAQGQFLEYLKGELNKGIPVKTSADRRRLIAQLKDFFRSKSTEEAYTFLFRALFNETIEIRYPGDDLLRVSDGNFLKQSTIRINERGVFQLGGEANVVSGNALVIGSNTDFTDFSTSDYFKIGTQQAVVSNVINATHMLATTNFTTTANNQFVSKLIPVDIFELKNKTIQGRTSGSIGVVADVRASSLGGKPYADVILRLISGAFEENEIIEDIENPSSNVIVYGVVSGININDGGTGYAVDDEVVITGDGLEATAKITSVSEAPITKIVLANTGIGYQNNLNAVVNNTGTGGTGFAVRISEIANTYTVGSNNQYTVGDTVSIRIVNRGSGYVALPTITLQDTAVASLGLLHDKLIRINNAGTLYQVGDALVFTNPGGFSGNTAVGRVAAVTERWAETPVILVATEIVEPYKNESLLDDFGSNTVSVDGAGDTEVGILIEGSYYDRLKTEDWRAIGPIERLELTYSANGNYAFGSGYSTASLPTVAVTSANGVGASLEVFNIQGKSAVINIDASNNIAGIGSIREVTILNQGIDYTTATIDASAKGDGNANLTADIGGLFVDSGRFTNDDGKINFKILQDSLFYQDFSYVIRSGLSFDRYKEIVKEVVHPAGLEFFGEIVITSTISLAANFSSQFAAASAPRFASLFSFLSLFEGIGLPPPVQSSIIVRIKPVVAYTDQAKLDTHREMNIEIAPTIINAGASTHTEYRPILSPVIDVGIFGAANVTVIPVSLGAIEYDVILAGASLPATFDPSGAVREINIEPIVVNQGITVIESTDQGLKGPLQFALGPVVVSAEFIFSAVAPRTEVSGGVGIIVSTSTFTDSEYNVEIPIFVNLAPTIVPSDQIATPKFFKTELNLAPQPIVEYTVDIESVYKRLPKIFGDLIIEDYASEIIADYADTPFDNTVYNVGSIVEIDLPPGILTQPLNVVPSDFFPDVRYIQPKLNMASTASAIYEIDLPIISLKATDTWGQLTFLTDTSDGTGVLSTVGNTSISTYSTVSLSDGYYPFGEIENLQTYSSIEIEIAPTLIDVSMAFYTNIVTMQTEIRTTEIDIELFKSVAPVPTNKVKIEIVSPADRYKDLPINAYSSQSIALYDDEPIQDRIALARSGFVNGKRSFVYGDAQLREFWNSTIEDLNPHIVSLTDTFETAYGNDTVRKHVPIEGTVNIGLQNIENVPLFNLAAESINTYAALTFNDPSGLRPVVIGSNTQFTTEFEIGDYIVVGNEKFIIKDIANTEYLEINVSATQNYTNVPAYREIFV